MPRDSRVKLYLEALDSGDFKSYIPSIKDNITKATKEKIIELGKSSHDYFLKNNETKFFLIIRFYVSLISDVLAIINNTTSAQYGSLLWHLLGVDNIDDQGIGMIHGNEKSQAVSFDFSGDSLTPVGTFKNYFKDPPIGQYYNMFIDIISDENFNWDFNIVTKKFDEISDAREWDLNYLKKMLKLVKPVSRDENEDTWYFWNDSMEGALWAFSEHENKDTGLLLLQYVIDNYPILKNAATYYYKELEKDNRDNVYWNKINKMYYKD